MEFSLSLTNSFKIAGILCRSNLNGLSDSKWYIEIELNNKHVFAFKMTCLSYRLSSHLRSESSTQCPLGFINEKRDALYFLFIFGFYKRPKFLFSAYCSYKIFLYYSNRTIYVILLCFIFKS